MGSRKPPGRRRDTHDVKLMSVPRPKKIARAVTPRGRRSARALTSVWPSRGALEGGRGQARRAEVPRPVLRLRHWRRGRPGGGGTARWLSAPARDRGAVVEEGPRIGWPTARRSPGRRSRARRPEEPTPRRAPVRGWREGSRVARPRSTRVAPSRQVSPEEPQVDDGHGDGPRHARAVSQIRREEEVAWDRPREDHQRADDDGLDDDFHGSITLRDWQQPDAGSATGLVRVLSRSAGALAYRR